MWNRVNIQQKLKEFRDKNHHGDTLLKEVYEILNYKSNIQNQLDSPTDAHNDFQFDLLDSERIYHIDDIKEICINYRLRFLSTKYFKGKYPDKELETIKEMEKEHHIKLK